ncbi:uncharacterized protein LOC143181875 [Calliopsis andreniformis]|uniref:uncharacterized protein LOC143181875 n=1 Tax=Calliopsis andreniformis TaxID=337506 RepID=UPI003FCEBA83
MSKHSKYLKSLEIINNIDEECSEFSEEKLSESDLNARHMSWGDRSNNQRGKYLNRWEIANDIKFKLKIISPESPTFKPVQTFLDLCLADSRLIYRNKPNFKAKVLPYDSDHSAISLKLDIATNWDKFTDKLANSYNLEIPDNRNLSKYEIEDYLIKINSIILNAMNNVIPKFKTENNTSKYVNNKIKKLQKAKRELVSILHKIHLMNPSSCIPLRNRAKKVLKKTNKALQNEFKLSIEKHWTNMLKKINHRDANNFFPRINRIFRNKHFDEINDLHIQKNDINLIDRSKCKISDAHETSNTFIFSNPKDKLNIIGAFYEQINSPRFLNTNTKLKQIVDNTATKLKTEFAIARDNNSTFTQFNDNNKSSHPITGTLFNPFCTIPSVEHIIRNLPNKSSSGLDNIPPLVLKNLPKNIISDITILFNNALNMNFFPSIWKKAKVLPILKKNKNPNDSSSYRPISLTPSLSKVYEAVINKKIVYHCNENNIIPDYQFGFRNQHSTPHAIHKLLPDINLQIGNSKIIGVALLDIEKAFDTVWLNGLLYKLVKKKFPKWLIYLIWDMIKDKVFYTWDGSIISSLEFSITEGLQQGTVNSPILFTIYTSDLLNLFGFNSTDGPTGLAFADDMILYIASNKTEIVRNKLEELVEKINKYYSNWNLKLNPNKCETILFRKPLYYINSIAKKGSSTFNISTTIPGTDTKVLIPHKKYVKYLGIHIQGGPSSVWNLN